MKDHALGSNDHFRGEIARLTQQPRALISFVRDYDKEKRKWEKWK